MYDTYVCAVWISLRLNDTAQMKMHSIFSALIRQLYLMKKRNTSIKYFQNSV